MDHEEKACQTDFVFPGESPRRDSLCDVVVPMASFSFSDRGRHDSVRSNDTLRLRRSSTMASEDEEANGSLSPLGVARRRGSGVARSPLTKRRSELIDKLMGNGSGAGNPQVMNNAVLSALPVSVRCVALQHP